MVVTIQHGEFHTTTKIEVKSGDHVLATILPGHAETVDLPEDGSIFTIKSVT